MGKIRQLSNEDINKIAAGEVVESPKNMVKELVENALDAGATEIEIEISQGGFERIAVKDNGCGMSSEDAVLSTERHATSKIRGYLDLAQCMTLGFRGEALSSIAAVSRITILTSEKTPLGVEVSVEPGKEPVCISKGRRRGTTVVVEKLFANTPARKAFQKSPAQSTRDIKQVCKALVLSHFGVSFTLVIDGKEEYRLHAAPSLERVSSLYEPSFTRDLRELKHDCFSGFFSPPDIAHLSRSHQFLFLNGRTITSPELSRAMERGYATMLNAGTFPHFFLWLQIEPDSYDVNIHPQKKEVAFREEEMLCQALQNAVRDAFRTRVVFEEEISREPLVRFEMPRQEVQFELREEPRVPDFEIVALVQSIAIVAREENLLIMDLVRAKKSLIVKEMGQGKLPAMQSLLFPIQITVSDQEVDRIEAYPEKLAAWGIEGHRTGPHLFSVEAVYPGYDEGKLQEVIGAMCRGEAWESQVENLRVGPTFSPHEVREIVRGILDARLEFSPTGKRIWKRCSMEQFAAIVDQ
ncbi:MAG: hypothetical protein A3F09_06040 [Chlamydiae bacterium RIFCSPHIGHO2_12_FULL_49_11]|nr:MAG: hypothetical protein A3F09_06040 [Chlamydiae bacterium RIFCSPHIGHO2_12_FULL_49_11]